MTLNLEVHGNLKVHIGLWQSFLMGQNSEASRTAPEVALPHLQETYWTRNDGFKIENTIQSTNTGERLRLSETLNWPAMATGFSSSFLCQMSDDPVLPVRPLRAAVPSSRGVDTASALCFKLSMTPHGMQYPFGQQRKGTGNGGCRSSGMGDSLKRSEFPYYILKQWRQRKIFKLDRSHSTILLMSQAGGVLSVFIVVLAISENCFLLQQKYSNISCFWERQPLGCMRISCAFHHSKPRYINGLFLPPSNNVPLQQGVQEGMLHPAHRQESLRNQKNILLPIHPPLIINLNDEEDEEDDEEEQNYVSNWVPKTDADIEEERAIKEMCYKSGEYYRIQYPDEHQSTKTVSSRPKNELLPLKATERDLQKGDGNTISTKINNSKREGERSGRRVPIAGIPRTDRRSFENGGIHTSDPKGKPCHQQRGPSKDDETAPSTPYLRETGRKTYFQASAPQRSAYVVYRSITVTQEPMFSGTTDKYPSGYYNAPTWRKRNPHAKPSMFKTTIQAQFDLEISAILAGQQNCVMN
ncbi:uncharacterized protein C12orf50 homolog [Larus michahellis]|uniref:uncharacterized protein C12orf50 homolog n=1 Tax=Larus michahellis TaxID=119627 RepID=UPI003D9AFB41